MSTSTASSMTRIAVGRRWPSWPTFLMLEFCVVAAIVFSVLASGFRVWAWWLGTGFAGLAAWALIHKELRRVRAWDDFTHLELGDGTVSYVPSRRMRVQNGLATAKASFTVGCSLECRIATGDRYFTGDHDQQLLTSLWTVSPDGTRHCLLSDVMDLNLRTTVSNLRGVGVPFRVVRVYDGQKGEHTETDITARFVQAPSRSRTPISILLGTSNLWLGGIAAALTHNVLSVVVVGILGFATVVSVALRSKTAKSSALIRVASALPSYAAGFAFAVVAVWYIFKR